MAVSEQQAAEAIAWIHAVSALPLTPLVRELLS